MADGVYDLYCQNTTPGANTVFAPPLGWAGSAVEYREWMRQQYRYDVNRHQQLYILARRCKNSAIVHRSIQFSGPYEDTAKDILDKLIKSL